MDTFYIVDEILQVGAVGAVDARLLADLLKRDNVPRLVIDDFSQRVPFRKGICAIDYFHVLCRSIAFCNICPMPAQSPSAPHGFAYDKLDAAFHYHRRQPRIYHISGETVADAENAYNLLFLS